MGTELMIYSQCLVGLPVISLSFVQLLKNGSELSTCSANVIAFNSACTQWSQYETDMLEKE